MDRVARIRASEKKYHDACYEQHKLFEPGSWLYKPVSTVMELVDAYKHIDALRVLDLGCGVGRNSIPIAQMLKPRRGTVICVDLLESAVLNLQAYGQQFDVEAQLVARLSDIEAFEIEEEAYDVIIAVSTLEHLSSEDALMKKLEEMAKGTRSQGSHCLIMGSNIREIDADTQEALDPMFELNMSTERLASLLEQRYAGWNIVRHEVKKLEYDIERSGRSVKLLSDCITFVASKP